MLKYQDIQAVVLDFGGVLVRTRSRRFRLQWEQKLGLQPGELDRIIFGSEISDAAMVGRGSLPQVMDYVQHRLSLNTQEMAQFQADFWREEFLDTDLLQAFKALNSQYKTAILSNIWTDGRKFFKDQYGLVEDHAIHRIFLSCEIGIAKPDQRIFHYLADELQVQFNQILFFDDTSANIEAAQSLGIRAHLFRNPADALAILLALAEE